MRPSDTAFVAVGLVLLAVGGLSAAGFLTLSVGPIPLGNTATPAVVAFNYSIHGQTASIHDQTIVGSGGTLLSTNITWGDHTSSTFSSPFPDNVTHTYTATGTLKVTYTDFFSIVCSSCSYKPPLGTISPVQYNGTGGTGLSYSISATAEFSIPSTSSGTVTSAATSAFIIPKFQANATGLIATVVDESVKATGLMNYTVGFTYGDGSAQTTSLSHAYARAGTYTITMIASGIVIPSSPCGITCASTITSAISANISLAPGASASTGTVAPPTVSHITPLNLALSFAGVGAIITPLVPGARRFIIGPVLIFIGFIVGAILGVVF